MSENREKQGYFEGGMPDGEKGQDVKKTLIYWEILEVGEGIGDDFNQFGDELILV